MNQLVEKIANEAHEVWAGWHKYQMKYCKQELVCGLESSDDLMKGVKRMAVIPTDKQERWDRQANTPYSELPESEKKSDIEIATRYLNAISISELIQYKAEQSLPEGYEIIDCNPNDYENTIFDIGFCIYEDITTEWIEECDLIEHGKIGFLLKIARKINP